jgi:hypothetical protein
MVTFLAEASIPLCAAEEIRMNKQINFTAYLFHPHLTSPIKGTKLPKNWMTVSGFTPEQENIAILPSLRARCGVPQNTVQ